MQHILYAGSKLFNVHGEALQKKVIEDLIEEEDLIDVKGVLGVQKRSQGCAVNGKILLEKGGIPVVIIGEGSHEVGATY